MGARIGADANEYKRRSLAPCVPKCRSERGRGGRGAKDKALRVAPQLSNAKKGFGAVVGHHPTIHSIQLNGIQGCRPTSTEGGDSLVGYESQTIGAKPAQNQVISRKDLRPSVEPIERQLSSGKQRNR